MRKVHMEEVGAVGWTLTLVSEFMSCEKPNGKTKRWLLAWVLAWFMVFKSHRRGG